MADPNGQNQSSDAQEKAAQYQKVQEHGRSEPVTHPESEPAEPVEQQVANQGADQPLFNAVDFESQLAAAKEEVEKTKEAMMRLAAELENTRRRSADEVAKAHKFAIESFAEALLPAKDSLEMALSLQNQTPEGLKEGVSATLRQLEQAFERGKIVVLDPKGDKFDPNRHQAVSMVPGDSVEPAVESNHVVAVMQKGYLINDRVLRPALVVVAQ